MTDDARQKRRRAKAEIAIRTLLGTGKIDVVGSAPKHIESPTRVVSAADPSEAARFVLEGAVDQTANRETAHECGDTAEWSLPSWALLRSHVVYRAWDGDQLLYVGLSGSVMSRFGIHMRDSAWWPRVTRFTFHPHPTREQAARCELQAIRTEHPPYNVIERTPLGPLPPRQPITHVRRVEPTPTYDRATSVLEILLRQCRINGWPDLDAA